MAKSPKSTPASTIYKGGALSFRAAGAITTGDDGQPRRRFVKDLIREGEWHKGSQVHTVTPDRLDRWAATFGKMADKGIMVPMPVSHTNDPTANRGRICSMFVDKDDKGRATLYGECEFIGEDAMALAGRTQVSIATEPDFHAGDGSKFEDAIVHVALVTDPVVPGQGGFVKLTASRGGVVNAPVFRLTEDKPMDFKKLSAELGIDPATMTDENAEGLMLSAIGVLKTNAAKAAEQATTITSLQASLAEKSKTVEVDPDAMEMAVESVHTRFDALISAGKLTPAARTDLELALCGTDKARPAMCLSRKAATAAGLTAPIADAVLKALDKNCPKLLGEKALSQGLTLARQTPDRSSNEADPAVVARMSALCK